MEKERLINFIATIMEDSGFKTHKNYPIANQIIDIYGTLETSAGEVGVVVACKNYEEPWKVGIDILKDMESAAKAIHASKILIFTTSSYSHGAATYAQKRNIKLVDRKGLTKIAKNYNQKRTVVSEPIIDEDDYDYEYDDYYSNNTKPMSLNPSKGNNSHAIFSGRFNRNNNAGSSLTNYSYQPRNYLNTQTTSRITNRFSFDIDNILEFFKNHSIVYLILLVVIASLISFIFNKVTSGPYTGVGKIITSAIVCYGGLLLVNRNLSDILSKGSIIFFISIFISIATLTI